MPKEADTTQTLQEILEVSTTLVGKQEIQLEIQRQQLARWEAFHQKITDIVADQRADAPTGTAMFKVLNCLLGDLHTYKPRK